MSILKIKNWIQDYNIVIFMLGIAFGWLIMWLVYITFAVISL